MNIAAHLARSGRSAAERPAIALGGNTLFNYGKRAYILDHSRARPCFAAPALAPGLSGLGGGPMYTADAIAAIERYGPKLAQLYGQGESPMTIAAPSAPMHAARDHPRWRARLESVGVPQSAVEVRTVNADGETRSNIYPREMEDVLTRPYRIVDELPNNNNGKVVKTVLKDLEQERGD